MRRITLGNPSATGFQREAQLRLGESPQDLGDTVTTHFCTSLGVIGSQEQASRADHQHHVAVGTASQIADVSLSTSTAGVSIYFPRVDHQHRLALDWGTSITNVSWQTSTGGVSTDLARGDHKHLILPGVRSSAGIVRTTSTPYTNLGSGPMYIGISLALSAPGAQGAHLIINGQDVAHADGVADTHLFIMGIANAGETYLLTASGGAHIEHWVEYGF